MKIQFYKFLFFCVCPLLMQAQQSGYELTRADSLMGQLTLERYAYDVTYYEIDIEVFPDEMAIAGRVDMTFDVKHTFDRMQIDLDGRLTIDSILIEGKRLAFTRDERAVFVQIPRLIAGNQHTIRVHYRGRPKIAVNPPWDGGMIWSKSNNDKHWIAVACQGEGASVWWPCKDHLIDEPDSVTMHITVGDGLVAVSNGRLRETTERADNKKTYTWHVSYPINIYNVTMNIGDYVHFTDEHVYASGDTLPLHYYVISYNLDRARRHFKQVHGVLEAFYHYLGPYPFIGDTYKLIETPFLGMEHQSAIAYGNLYRRGYLGQGIPRDMDFDYIILHESGHEYFGNALSATDLADMWLHESFTTYLESLYVEYHMDYAAAMRYLRFQRPFITNKNPIIGRRGFNWYKKVSSTDQYYKGAWVLNTLRHMLNDDDAWWHLFYHFFHTYKFRPVLSEDFFYFASGYFPIDLYPFFYQYLYSTSIPRLEARVKRNSNNIQITYQLKNIEEACADLAIPYHIDVDGHRISLLLEAGQKTITIPLFGSGDIQWPEDQYLIDLAITDKKKKKQ